MTTKTPPGIGLLRLFTHPVRYSPDKVAVIDDHASITFGAADAQANRLAHALAAAGTRPGDRIAFVLPNSVAFVVIEIAIVKAGMVKVPLNFRFHLNEVLYALADCEASVILCDASLADAINAAKDRLPSVKAIFSVGGARSACPPYEDAVASGAAAPVAVPYGEDAPCLIRYTGGTTGRPKGIVHTEQSLVDIARDVISEFRLRKEDVALHLGHLSHGLDFVWPAFYGAGTTQVLRERFDPVQVLADIQRHRVSFVYMVPTMVQRLLAADDGSADTSSLRIFWISSAPMPVPVLRQAIARYGNIFAQAYTLSEAPVITTLLRIEEHVDKETRLGSRLGSCGRELLTMELELLDDDGNEVAPGEVGEIAVRSANNMREYWRLPEETAATLRDGWVLTGDLAARDEDGYLYIVDRKKDIIITGAFNVYPKEVEDVLYAHPAVAACGVVGIPDADLGEAIKAYVVVREGTSVTADELIGFCRDHLASYKKPRAIEFVSALPLTPVGKISRRALRDKAKREKA